MSIFIVIIVELRKRIYNYIVDEKHLDCFFVFFLHTTCVSILILT